MGYIVCVGIGLIEIGKKINNEERNVQHKAAFGEHTGIHESVRKYVTKIKNNEPPPNYYCFNFELRDRNGDRFSDLAWELLRRYFPGKNYVDDFCLDDMNLANSQMVLICRGLENAYRGLDRVGFVRNLIGLTSI